MECSLCLCLELAAVILVLAMAWRWYRGRLLVDGRHNKCVFITGCDSGFGLALARSLDTKGVPVFAGCLTEDGARKLNEQTSSRLKVIMVNVMKHDTIQKAREFVEGSMPSGSVLWGIVNNAGIFEGEGPTEYFSADDYRKHMEVNFVGVAMVCNTFMPLIKNSRGRIVNMSSIGGLLSYPRLSPYVASKFATVGYTDCLRREKSVWGIKVSTIEPSLHKTAIAEPVKFLKMKQQQWSRLPEELRQEYDQDQFVKAADVWGKLWNECEGSFDAVIQAYEHALFAVHPQAHYNPDRTAKLLVFFSYLPAYFIENAFKPLVADPIFIPRCVKQ